jgi:hypothetical protein
MWNSKPKSWTCNCRPRSRGNPKVSAGVCYLCFDYRPAVMERIKGKKLEKIYLEALDPEEVDE